MVLVRPITENDIGGFHAALDSVARESNFLRSDAAPPIDAVASFVRQNIESQNPQVVAVDEQHGVVGWCDIVRARGRHENHVGELGMGIVADWRGRGIGRQLLVDTIAAADISNFLRIELSVHSDNHKAIALYRRFGFVDEGRKLRARMRNSGTVDIFLMARLRPEQFWPGGESKTHLS
ncbi:MAG TPA: GNAT family N-acetyltransferase [Devosia sp.]|nr:GNAT family N-acetyltransferase [Devosia sp.]